MQYLSIFIIFALLCGGYYEYTLQQKTDVTYQEKINDLEGKVTQLQSDKTELETQKSGLSKNLADAQAKVSDLNAKLAAIPPVKKEPPPPPPPPPPPSFNDLGTVTAADGKTYQNCWLLRVETDGITFKHSTGITKVLFPILPSTLQKKFGYNAHVAPNLTPEAVQALETQRINAPKSSDH